MSARAKLTHLAGKIALLLVVIFVMTVVLAAMPGHHGSSTQNPLTPARGPEKKQPHLPPKRPAES